MVFLSYLLLIRVLEQFGRHDTCSRIHPLYISNFIDINIQRIGIYKRALCAEGDILPPSNLYFCASGLGVREPIVSVFLGYGVYGRHGILGIRGQGTRED